MTTVHHYITLHSSTVSCYLAPTYDCQTGKFTSLSFLFYWIGHALSIMLFDAGTVQYSIVSITHIAPPLSSLWV